MWTVWEILRAVRCSADFVTVFLIKRVAVITVREMTVSLLLQQRPTSLRDAATLTEDSRGLHRALRLNPEEGGEHPGVVRPAEQESGSEEDFEEELELMEGRKQRHTGVGGGSEKRKSNKTAGRYLRDF